MYTIEVLDVVTTAGVLYIVALGLLIVYGVLKIINLAHGAFLALGSYAAVIATWLGWNPWSALVIALAAGVAVGAVAEWRVLRGLYVRPLELDPGDLGSEHHHCSVYHAIFRPRNPVRRERYYPGSQRRRNDILAVSPRFASSCNNIGRACVAGHAPNPDWRRGASSDYE